MLEFLADATPTAPDPISNAGLIVLQGLACLAVVAGGGLWAINQWSEMLERREKRAKQAQPEKPQQFGPQPFVVQEHRDAATQDDVKLLAARIEQYDTNAAAARKKTYDKIEAQSSELTKMATRLECHEDNFATFREELNAKLYHLEAKVERAAER